MLSYDREGLVLGRKATCFKRLRLFSFLVKNLKYERNAEIYKVLANPKRLEILNILKKRELAVEKLIKTMKIRKANLSQHLAILRQHRLVKTRRSGQRILYYSFSRTI